MSQPAVAAGFRVAGRAAAGIALVVAAVACFAVLDTTSKRVGLGVPVLMALWFRYAFQAMVTTAVVWPQRGMRLWHTRHPRFQLLRGVLLLSTSFFAFLSLRYMPVGEFTALVMITPLAITVLAATVLKERASLLRWALVAGGFAGTLVIVRPGGDGLGWVALLPLCVVASNACFQVLTSRMSRTEDPVTMHVYTGWVGTLALSLALPFVWQNISDPWLWGGLALMGLAGTVGHFFLIMAYQRAPAATLVPYLYMQIPFAVLGGWLVFGHSPDLWSWVGMGMIALCGAMGAWLTVRERHQPLSPAEA